MHISIYDDMNPQQFKEYYKTCRETLFCLKENVNATVSTINNLLHSKDGLSINVQRYQKIPPDPKHFDLGRCKNTKESLEKKSVKVKDLLDKVERRRANLFDEKQKLYKSYTSFELEYYDDFITKLNIAIKELSMILSKVTHSHTELSKRIKPFQGNEAEGRRRSRRKKEQKRKKRNRHITVKVKSANRICTILCKEALVKKPKGKDPIIDRKIEADEFQRLAHTKLSPKLHLAGMELLLSLDAFNTLECKENAESVCSVLRAKKHLQVSKKPRRDEHKNEDKTQKTLLGWLNKAPAPNEPDETSEESIASDESDNESNDSSWSSDYENEQSQN